jgi:hypothetical protein
MRITQRRRERRGLAETASRKEKKSAERGGRDFPASSRLGSFASSGEHAHSTSFCGGSSGCLMLRSVRKGKAKVKRE